MSKPVAEMVGVASGENLGLGFQTAKGPRVNDSVAISLKIVAIGMRRLSMTPSAGLRNGIGSKNQMIG
jgi:hypothetical protein